MKKIIIIDGGPRKNFNTASMLQKFAEGASSVSKEIEVKTVRLYDLDYKGCMSCMVCKIKGKVSNVCKYKDALTPILEEIAQHSDEKYEEGMLALVYQQRRKQ